MERHQLSRNDFITMLNHGGTLISGSEIVRREDDGKKFLSYRLRDRFGEIIENLELLSRGYLK